MTGLRLDKALGVLGKRLGKLKASTSALEFRTEVAEFTRKTLVDCIQATPVRNEGLIQSAQIKQYRNRINYIPSVHTLENPTLIVNEMGQEWVYSNGKWYNASEWKLPNDVLAAYEELSQERSRRIDTAQGEFIAERKQSRFLYQRSWWQVAQSLGLSVIASAAIIASRTRRNPPKEPPKAYGQWRGGKNTLTVIIYNMFLSVAGKYWNGNGKAILAQATAKNRPSFLKAVNDKVKRKISASRRTA